MHKISTRQIVADIQSGLDDDQLMAKYDLPRKLFQRLLQRLVVEKIIGHQDLYERSATYRYISDILLSRSHPRVYIPMALRVYRDGNSQRGLVRDISEKGIRVAGIQANPGQTVSLSIPMKEVPPIGPVRLEAICRWSERKGEDNKVVVSGFEITTISEVARDGLLQLMDWFRVQTDDEEQEISNSLKTLQWPKLALELEPSTESRDFSGTVCRVDILDLLHFMVLSGHEKILNVQSSDGHSCRVHISKGKIVHADGGDLEGREALFRCASFPGGSFSTQSWEEPRRHTIFESPDFLLFEAARRRDELQQQERLSEQPDHRNGVPNYQRTETCNRNC
jgi:hypothetical protein